VQVNDITFHHRFKGTFACDIVSSQWRNPVCFLQKFPWNNLLHYSKVSCI